MIQSNIWRQRLERLSTFYNTRLDVDRAVPTMATIRLKITFHVAGDRKLLCIRPVELAAVEMNRLFRVLGHRISDLMGSEKRFTSSNHQSALW
jgi:hypothetical protein